MYRTTAYSIAPATLETRYCEEPGTDTYLSCDFQHINGASHDVQHSH